MNAATNNTTPAQTVRYTMWATKNRYRAAKQRASIEIPVGSMTYDEVLAHFDALAAGKGYFHASISTKYI